MNSPDYLQRVLNSEAVIDFCELSTTKYQVLLARLLHPRTRVVCYGVQAEPGTMDAKMLSSILYFILYFCSLGCMYGAHADPGAMGANATSHLRCFH